MTEELSEKEWQKKLSRDAMMKKISDNEITDIATIEKDVSNLAKLDANSRNNFALVVENRKIPIAYSSGRFHFITKQDFSDAFKNFMEQKRVNRKLSGLPGDQKNALWKEELFIRAVEEDWNIQRFTDEVLDVGRSQDKLQDLWLELQRLKKERMKEWLLSMFNGKSSTQAEKDISI